MRNAELEAAIAAAPDDPDAYLVYADWLQSQGDPRGELISLQHRMREQKEVSEFARFKKHEEALRELHGIDWLGERVALARRTRFDWRLGFVSEARFAAAPQALVEMTGDVAHPYAIKPTAEATLVELVTSLVCSTCGWLVRTLHLSGTLYEVRAALEPLPTPYLGKLVLTTDVDVETSKRVLSPTIMKMLNANVDVDLTGIGYTEPFRWKR